MKDLQSYTELLEREIQEISFPNEPAELYDPLRYFLQLGGKRIRPILTLLAADLFGTDSKTALPQALAIELFHNFSLIHDDIMDAAPTRRSQETVHEKWNSNVAILSGDVLLIIAYQKLTQIAPEKLPAAVELFNRTAIEVCEGQQMDLNFELRMDVTVSEYLEMIRLKTSVLLGAALKLGAIVAGASVEDQNHLYDFGQNLGIAFQIQDDILDLYADPDKFGKMVGGDVAANKKTLLHLIAVTEGTREHLNILEQLQHFEDIPLKIAKTKELFDHLDVKGKCRETMETYQHAAMDSLNKIDASKERKQGLIALAEFLLNRDL